MASDKQIEANRRNVRLSTGPTSAKGKAIASRNSLRHGFVSRTPLIRGESQREYNKLCDELDQLFQPRDSHERFYVMEMVDARWRLRSLRGHYRTHMDLQMEKVGRYNPGYDVLTLQAVAFTGLDSDGAMKTLLRYEEQFKRQYDQAYGRLMACRTLLDGEQKPKTVRVTSSLRNEANFSDPRIPVIDCESKPC